MWTSGPGTGPVRKYSDTRSGYRRPAPCTDRWDTVAGRDVGTADVQTSRCQLYNKRITKGQTGSNMSTMNHQSHKTCIDACAQCAQTCEQCAQHCLGSHPECAKVCIDCAQACAFAVATMSRSSQFHSAICGLCADICDACATECDKHADHGCCKKCAEDCRRCAAECRKVAVAH